MQTKTVQNNIAGEVRERLVEVGGRTSQDLGLGRIFGQVLVYLYLTETACSLDRICRDLGLSKASVSIAARQLESLGLLRRLWKKGDRKNYYRTADNIADALQQGLLSFIRQRVRGIAVELDESQELMEGADNNPEPDPDMQFLSQRIARARTLQKRTAHLLDNPVINFFIKTEASQPGKE